MELTYTSTPEIESDSQLTNWIFVIVTASVIGYIIYEEIKSKNDIS
jgi:hypothetical protein